MSTIFPKYFREKAIFTSASSASSSAMITHIIYNLIRFSGRAEEKIHYKFHFTLKKRRQFPQKCPVLLQKRFSTTYANAWYFRNNSLRFCNSA